MYLLDSPICRVAAVSERDRQAAARTIAALSKLAAPFAPASETVTRPRYFAGMLIDAATLQTEEDYHREKLPRHNRELNGVGIVHRLGAHVEEAAETPNGRVHVEPGYALDPCGNGIALCRGAAVALPQGGEPLFVSLRHWETPASPVGEPTPSRIEEACVVAVVDVVAEPAIGPARLFQT